MDFEWDEAKDLTNRQNHGLGFAEAAELFESGARGLIVVVYTEPEEDTVRIISAREATRREQSLFREYMNGIQ